VNNPDHLNNLMHFDHVVRVLPDGDVVDAPNVFAPEVYVQCADDDCGSITKEAEEEMITSVEAQGWELMTGYTGQYGYRGPIMHVSEYVGGGLAEDILARPGLYVVVEPQGMYATEEQEEAQSGEAIGWVVARKLDNQE
jgi:hypothetical protein